MTLQSGVAPADLLRQDFRALDARETLRTTWPIEEMILMQSVHGHAHEGHGAFRGSGYPNTTLDDVTRALRLDPAVIRHDRQSMIDEIAAYAEAVITGERPRLLAAPDGHPFLGISSLRFVRVDPLDVLRGLYLGGLRDDSDVRAEVERARGVRIGGGRCCHVNMTRMRQMGLNADELAHGEWAADLPRFEREGLIVEAARAADPDVEYQYIRHRRGPGASDDSAIVCAGLVWGLGVAVGVFLADAIDTLEKYVPVCGDRDRDLAVHIEAALPGLGLGRSDVHRLTYLAATPEGREDDVPDSSLRHLLSVDRTGDICALESHLLCVEGIDAPSIGLSHRRTPSHRFYAYARERVASA